MRSRAKYFLITTLLLIALPLFTQAKNLSILSSGRIQNYELLDVYLHGTLAYIPAGLGGLNIVNISNPSNPVVLSSYSADGCDWGRIYAWAANDNYAFGVGRECGVHILNVSNPELPVFVTTYSDASESELRYEHAELLGPNLFLSRHQFGVEIVNISDPNYLRKVSVIPTENAWASLATDSLLFIADGASGIKIVAVSATGVNPEVIASLPTSGTAKDLSLSGNYLFVAVGAAGVDMIDVSDPTHPVLKDNYNTTGYASRISANNVRVAVSDWDDVEILDYSTGKLELDGYKNTGGRVMALAMAGDIIYSAEWEDLTVYRYEEITSPDIDLSTMHLEFPRTQIGEAAILSFTLSNSGASSLEISNVVVSDADYSIAFDAHSIPANTDTEVKLSYHPNSGAWTGNISFDINDLDEPSKTITMNGNHPFGPMVGDAAPAFLLESVNGYGTVSTNTLHGRPVVLAFFTAW